MADKKTGESPVIPDTPIPDRMFFKIREVAGIVGVKPHVLRYWESEFPSLKPKKNKSGQRIYTRKDIDSALEIRRLLHVERFSIAGARQHLKKKKGQGPRAETFGEIRQVLGDVLDLLEDDIKKAT